VPPSPARSGLRYTSGGDLGRYPHGAKQNQIGAEAPSATQASPASESARLHPRVVAVRSTLAASRSNDEHLQRRQKRREVGFFLAGEIEAERHLVVMNDRRQILRDAIVEVRRARG